MRRAHAIGCICESIPPRKLLVYKIQLNSKLGRKKTVWLWVKNTTALGKGTILESQSSESLMTDNNS